MFAVRIQGGLGNQIYQYLFALELKERFPGTEVCIDLDSYRRYRPHNGYELERWVAMDPRIRTVTWAEHLRLTGQLPWVGSRRLLASPSPAARLIRKATGAINRCIDLVNRLLPEKPGIIRQEYTHGYPQVDISGLDPERDHYFDGTWFSQSFSEQILQGRFPEKTDTEFPGSAEKLRSQEAVSIHIRHGDYPAWGYEVLSDGYYRRAIALIRERVKDPAFYIFSDDPGYAANVIAPMCGGDATVVNRESKADAFLDLQLMACCTHHIIANSTFSLAGWTFSSKEGLLIAPRTWINGNRTWEIPDCHYLDA